MIIKVLLKGKDGEKDFTMLFGNSYKPWQMQFCEFMFRYYKPDLSMGWRLDYVQGKVIRAWKSNAKWKSWGGLKWCEESEFQKELNREGVQQNELDNPKPRKYEDMEFANFDVSNLEKALKDY